MDGSGCMAGGWGEWMVGLWWMFGGAGVRGAGCWVYDWWLVGCGVDNAMLRCGDTFVRGRCCGGACYGGAADSVMALRC